MQLSKVAPSRNFLRGHAVSSRAVLRVQPFRPIRLNVVSASDERLRLHNLSPQEGSRRKNKRKGRGHAAGQGATCGFGTRGQKSRSGPGPRAGFEGGQTPLYRRLPKLRGIAGGMGAGLPKFAVLNLDDLEKHFEAGQEVSLEVAKEKGLLSLTGSDKKLSLKVLGNGELTKALAIKAAKFSESALQKIQSAGGTAEIVEARAKWTRKAYERKIKEYAAEGKDYKKEVLEEKKAAAKERYKEARAALAAIREKADKSWRERAVARRAATKAANEAAHAQRAIRAQARKAKKTVAS